MTIQEFKSKLDIPLIVSPMFLVSSVQLITESCKHGIAAVYPSLNGRTTDEFEKVLIEINHELEKEKKHTNKVPAPFGVNIIVNKNNQRALADLEICIKYKVPFVVTSLGSAKEIVDKVHHYGGLVFHDVIKKRHAEKAAESGVDGIIVVCAGAGGHAGTANPFALISEIKKFYNGAIILAGGINKGNDILAAQNMGADFAYMGTRMIATEESLASKEYKQLLIESSIDNIVYTNQVSGVHANFIKQTLINHGIDFHSTNSLSTDKLSETKHKAWKNIWSAGHAVAGIHSILKVKDLIQQLKMEYKNQLIKNNEILKQLNF